MKIGGVGGAGSMPRSNRSTVRKAERPAEAPPKHEMNMKSEPRRPVAQRPYRRGMTA